MNMIETVAKALAASDPEHDPDWDYSEQAKAAINALREPSDAMLAAGVVHDDATYSTWCAMIDAALVDAE